MSVPDHGPLIVGITWWLTILCGGFLALRIYAKISRRQGLWWDDHILIISWIFLFIETIVTQVGQALGFGKRIQDVAPENVSILAIGILATSSISCFASTLSKVSFGVTLLRLTSGPLRWFIWFCVVTLLLLMLPSAFNTWIQCTPTAKIWDPTLPGTCWPSSVRVYYGVFNAAWCALADFALALIPWKLIWNLQLQLREKIGVGIAMSLGILAGICAIVKGLYLKQLAAQDFSYDGKDVVIWTAVETATAIIAACIPVLRVFFREVSSQSYSFRGRSNNTPSFKGVPLSRINRSHTSSHMATVQALGKDKNPTWTTIGRIEDESADGSSERAILGDEEQGLTGSSDAGILRHEDDCIIQTNTVTVTVERDTPSNRTGRSWIDTPT